jgi:hypothetical protein
LRPAIATAAKAPAGEAATSEAATSSWGPSFPLAPVASLAPAAHSLCRRGWAVDDVVKLADRDCSARRGRRRGSALRFARFDTLEHAHQANVFEFLSSRSEDLQQSRQPIAADTELGLDRRR